MIKLLKKLKAWIIFLIIGALTGGVVWAASINILTIHSHPLEGELWTISFETEGLRDLIITPDDQNTINDMDFVSLKCGGKERTPQILENDVILYENWLCFEEAEIVHIINRTDHHYLKFQFGKQEAYAYNSPALIDGVISYWKLDDNLDTSAVLDAHASNDGTVVNDQTSYSSEQSTATAKIGTAFDMDGSNDYVLIGNIGALNTDYMTVSAWVKTSTTGSIDFIYCKDSTVAETERSWQFRKADDEKLDFIVFTADAVLAVSKSTTSISDGAWHHVVGTYDGSNIKVYVDGDNEDTDALVGVVQKQSNEIFISLSETTSPGHWNGELDEIGVWNRALIQSEVTALYNGGDGFAYPFGEVAVKRTISVEPN